MHHQGQSPSHQLSRSWPGSFPLPLASADDQLSVSQQYYFGSSQTLYILDHILLLCTHPSRLSPTGQALARHPGETHLVLVRMGMFCLVDGEQWYVYGQLRLHKVHYFEIAKPTHQRWRIRKALHTRTLTKSPYVEFDAKCLRMVQAPSGAWRLSLIILLSYTA